ncbi:uncharacterized protein FYW23_005013 isoform 1-T1 [Sylvia borin]
MTASDQRAIPDHPWSTKGSCTEQNARSSNLVLKKPDRHVALEALPSLVTAISLVISHCEDEVVFPDTELHEEVLSALLEQLKLLKLQVVPTSSLLTLRTQKRPYVILICWVASYLMSAHGRNDYFISPSWLGGHMDTFMKVI